jgi:hypothetical protein
MMERLEARVIVIFIPSARGARDTDVRGRN